MNLRLLFAVPSLLLACGGSAPPAAEPTAPAAEGFAAQAAAGQELYGKHCAECHGAHGNDGKAPPVVGLDNGALPLDPPATAKFRKTQFKTVADVADFVVKSMPPKAPGSLSADEYYAILAFDLKANGIDLGDKQLDGALASTLDIPRK
ncbi:MAG TPA: cytochrome c [Polyangiaceae bacterium]|nr:cytochrome c [Polyangiaceae bacterium]